MVSRCVCQQPWSTTIFHPHILRAPLQASQIDSRGDDRFVTNAVGGWRLTLLRLKDTRAAPSTDMVALGLIPDRRCGASAGRAGGTGRARRLGNSPRRHGGAHPPWHPHRERLQPLADGLWLNERKQVVGASTLRVGAGDRSCRHHQNESDRSGYPRSCRRTSAYGTAIGNVIGTSNQSIGSQRCLSC
jgi:hypothetical protein